MSYNNPSRKHRSRLSTPVRLCVAAVAACFIATPVLSNPVNPVVVNGAATFNQVGNLLTVTNSNGAIINWDKFSIKVGETTHFAQTAASSTVLNRVLNDPTAIYGTLSSNGRVWLVNPAGIMVGPGGRVDTAGFVASTLNISNENFLAGRNLFINDGSAGDVINQGEIRTPAGGSVYLIGSNVSNEGIITTPKGETILAAGNTVSLIDSALPGVKVDITGAEGNATNLGTITAEAGRIGIAGVIVRNSGQINASSVVSEGGRIFLRATKKIELTDTSRVGADGTAGGNVTAIVAENGRITGELVAHGEISAQGNGQKGSGGFIETSAAKLSIADGFRVATRDGQWLLDPYDFTIAASGGDITGATLSTALGAGAVTIQTAAASVSCSGAICGTGNSTGNGDIFVNDVVSWSVNSILTLDAYRNININQSITATGTTAKLALNYGQGAIASGNAGTYNVNAAVNLPAGPNFSTKLGSDGVVKNYSVITSLGAASSITGSDLQGMNGGLATNYALGSDIHATATATWNSGAGFLPVGNSTTNFTGTFDGLKHTITGLTINRPTPDYAGLFGAVGSAGIVLNVGLVGGSVSGSTYASNAAVGGLVGYNYGTISNSYNTGSVVNVGRSFAGGLVGTNEGIIRNSYATGNVTIVESRAGGLVGHNSGTISNSYATGNVLGGCCANGGLVGHNAGSISNSYSTGSASGSYMIGGLVGEQSGSPSVSNSFWDTTTSGQGGSLGGTGLGTLQTMSAASVAAAGFDLTNTWWLSEGNTRPFLRSEYSTTITNAHQLQLMGMNAATLAANYTLGANINMAELGQASGLWNTTTGFVPVGDAYSNYFSGTFDGLGHTITGLTINRPSTNYVGLFGMTNAAAISNVGLVGGNITGSSVVGGLAGYNYGGGSTISNSYSTGSVSGIDYVGGLVGVNGQEFGPGGPITNSYSTGAVSGNNWVGGLAGINRGAITNSYSTGAVSGSNGGLVGATDWGGTVTNSYWDTETSGKATSAGGTGLTTAQMKQLATFSGWSIASTGGSSATWRIYEGNTRPLLRSFLAPITLTPVYDGTAQTLTNIGDYTANIASPVSANIINAGGLTLNSSATAGSHTAALNVSSTQQGYDISASRTITGTGSAANDLNIAASLGWSAGKLTLNAQNNININADLNGSGTASLALQYGQGAIASGNAATYNVNAAVNLLAGPNFSTKLGFDGTAVHYTVITSLGAAGSTTGTDLQGMNGGLAGMYALGSNIDASATSGWNSGAGFAPVGNSSTNFTGIFDGLGHTIAGLTVNRGTTDYVGLFGYTGTGSILRNLGLVNVNIIGRYAVGGLVGSNWSAISNSYTTGTVFSTDYGVGGLAGRNYKTIENSYSTANVTGSNAGGLVGIQGSTVDVGSTNNSYATGNVTGTGNYTGGLMGYNYANSTISNSYGTGAVSGGVNYLGGLAGGNDGLISNSYSTGSVTGSSFAGGLVGYAGGSTVTNSFWDTETSGKTTSAGGGTGKTSAEMRQQATFSGFDFTNTWWLSEGNTRPFLRTEYSTSIANAHQLQLMAMNPGATYTLSNNFDLSPALAAVNSKYPGMWGTAGFVPVGDATTKFTGTFDGLGRTITGLTINRSTMDYVGLFGYANGATIRNVGLEGGNVSGGSQVGELVGKGDSGTTISNSYATGNVSGTSRVGGLVGDSDNQSTVSYSYSTGNVSGVSAVGGLVGGLGVNGVFGSPGSYSVVANSYSTGGVSGSGAYVGGLVGLNHYYSTINNSYSTGVVSGGSGSGIYVGGLAGLGYSWGGVNNSYWDAETSGKGTSFGGTGKTSAEMRQQTTFSGFDFTNTWWLSEGNTRPFLRSEYSTTITNAHQLQLMGMNATTLAATYTLAANINMAELSQTSGLWNTAAGFLPVGNSTTNFTGTLDGLGHTIAGLTINRPTSDYAGLFGYIGTGSAVRNVGLVGGSVTGGTNYVGGLAGYSNTGATIANSYNTGSVSGTNFVGGLAGYNNTGGAITNSYSTGSVGSSSGGVFTGGLVGVNYGAISNSCSTGSVSGTGYVGGLAGIQNFSATITNSYSTGSVSGTAGNWVGGLVSMNSGSAAITNSYSTGSVSVGSGSGGLAGYNNGGAITNSYWDKDTSGQATSAGGTGLTTAQMMQSANLTGFDFTNVWNIVPGISYPYLKWQFSAAPQVLSGLATGAAAGKTIQAITNGVDLAKTFTGANGFYYFALPGNSVPNGNTLLTFVAGDAYKGAAAYGSAGSHATGMAIAQNALTIAGGAVSNNSLGTAKGALASADVPYSVSGNNLSLSSGIAFQTLSGASYTLDGNVTTVDAAQTWGGPVSMTGNAILATGNGDIAINGAISGATRNLTLNTSGKVTQGAAITVAGLELLGTGGTYTLNHGSNAITTLAGNAAAVSFTESNGFTVGTVNSTSGLATTGDLALMANGPLTVSQAVSSTSGGGILLAAQGNTGTADLTVNASVSASGGTGGIDLYAGDSIYVSGSGVNVSAVGAGAINLYAGRNYNGGTVQAGNSGGGVWQYLSSAVKSDDGNIGLYAAGNIVVDEVHANGNGDALWGDVFIKAGDNAFGVGTSSGTIDNNGGGPARPHVTANKVSLRSTGNIGWMGNGPNHFYVDATELDVNISGSHAALGDINDTRGDGLTLTSVLITGNSGYAPYSYYQDQGLFLQQTNSGGLKLGSMDVFGPVHLITNGAITDTNGAAMNILSRNATTVGSGVVLRAGTGVGTLADPIEIQASTLAGAILNTGVFSVANTGALEIGSVSIYGTHNGITMTTGSATPGDDIVVTTDGALSVTQPIANKLAGAISLAGTSFSQSNVDISAAGGAISIIADALAIAANTGNNALQTSGALTLKPKTASTAMSLAGTAAFDLTAAEVTDIAGGVTGAGTITIGDAANADAASAMTVGGPVSFGAKTVTLNAASFASAGTDTIAATTLNLNATSGNIGSASGAGAIDIATTTVTANTAGGSAYLKSAAGYAVGVSNVGGGALSLETAGAVTQSGAITAQGLQLLGTGGTYTLTDAGNSVTTLAGNTGSISFTNSGSFTVATTHAAKFAYVANIASGNVSVYSVDQSTGALTQVGTTNAGTGPSSIAVDPTGRFAFVANITSNDVSAFAIDQATGALTPVGTAPAANAHSVTVDPTGRFLYAGNRWGNEVSVFIINQTTGALSAGTALAGTYPVTVVVDPTGKFAYAVNYASESVSAFTINQATGALSAAGTLGVGTTPRWGAADPTGRFFYVSNGNSNSISVYTINPATGALTAAGAAPAGLNPEGIAVDPRGKFLYAANNQSNNVSVFTIDQTTGALTAGAAAGAGAYPTNVSVDPTGKFAYVTNKDSNNVSVYAIDQVTGALTAGAPVAAGTTPYSVAAANVNGGVAGITATGDVTLAALGNGTITVTNSLFKQGAAAATFTLQANDSIVFNTSADIGPIGGGSNAINVVLNSDRDASSGGNVQLNAGTVINSIGGNITLGGGTPGDGTGNAIGNALNPDGIYLAGATLDAGGGSVKLRGTGFAGTSSSGIHVADASAIQTTGSGTITLNGTGGAGTNTNRGVYIDGAGTAVRSVDGNISLTGLGAGSGYDNRGIYLSHGAKVASVGAGNVTLDGTGSAAGTDDNYGVYIKNLGTEVSASSGAVSITGHGAGSGTDNFGVHMYDFAKVASAGSGNISLIGTGGASTGSYNTGVYISDSSAIAATGAGGVSLNGTGGSSGTAGVSNRGVRVSSAASISTNSGAIDITGTGGYDGDGIQIVGGAHAQSVSGTITLLGTAVDGSSSDAVYVSDAGTLVSSSGNIGITGHNLSTMGSGNRGVAITSSAQVVATGAATITVAGQGGHEGDGLHVHGGALVQSGTGLITLSGTSGDGIGSNWDWGVEVGDAGTLVSSGGGMTITGISTSTDGTYSNYGLLVRTGAKLTTSAGLMTLNGTSGAGTTSDGVRLSGTPTGGVVNAAAGLTINGTGDVVLDVGSIVNVGSGSTGISGANITLNAGSVVNTATGVFSTLGNLNVDGTVSAGDVAVSANTFTLNGGTWNQVSAALPGFTANDFRIAGGSFIRALSGDGTAGDPYRLADIHGVQGMGSAGMLGKSYVLANNIDAAATSAWNFGAGFVPVGSDSVRFAGQFDGQGHTIAALTINRPSQTFVGLFGGTGSGSVVRNVGLVGGNVSGYQWVGGLVGVHYGSIDGVYNTGNVSAGPNYVGGLAGSSATGSSINNSYATGNVTGSDSVGGLLGYSAGGSITNSYATGGVAGSSNAGGLVGYSAGGTVSNSNWDIATSHQIVSAGGTGRTTAEMMAMASFAGWSIADSGGSSATWRIYEGSTYPLLRSFMTPLTVTAGSGTKVYDGTPDAATGVTYSMTPDGAKLFGTLTYAGGSKNVGTGYTITPAGQYSDQQGYDLSSVSGTLTITALQLTVGGSTTAASKTYDRSVTASVSGGNVSGILSGDSAVSFVQSGSFGDWNVGTAKPVTYSNSLTGAGATNYSLSSTGGSTAADIVPATLALAIGGVNKVYDGNSTATAVITDNRISGDVLSVDYSANFGDRHVAAGKSVALSGINLTGTDAGNYSLATTSGSTTASITQRPSVTWIGGTDSNWSTAANWAGGALPDRANVATVIVDSGTVTYDYSSAPVDTPILNSLTLSGGILTVNNGTLAVPTWQQSAGDLRGTGGLTVSQSMTMNGNGIIDVGGPVNITHAGNLQLGGIATAGALSVIATGSITGTTSSGSWMQSAGSVSLASIQGGAPGGLAISTDTQTAGTITAQVQSGAAYGGIAVRNHGAAPTTVALTDSATYQSTANFTQYGALTVGSGATSVSLSAGDVALQSTGDMILTGAGLSLGVPAYGSILVSSGENLTLDGASLNSPPNNIDLGLAASGNLTLTHGALAHGEILTMLSGGSTSLYSGSEARAWQSATLNANSGLRLEGSNIYADIGDVRITTGGDIRANNGSGIFAGNSAYLTLNGVNSTVYVNDAAGLLPSYIHALNPSTIHLDFPARTTQDEVVIDGIATNVTSGSSGFFVGNPMQPARFGAGLVITSAAQDDEIVPDQVINAINKATEDASTTKAPTEDKVPTPETPKTDSTKPLVDLSKTTGGTEGSFGGEEQKPPAETNKNEGSPTKTASSGKDEGAKEGGKDDKKDEQKDEKDEKDKKDKKDKKSDEAKDEKKDDKPAAKKVAQCS